MCSAMPLRIRAHRLEGLADLWRTAFAAERSLRRLVGCWRRFWRLIRWEQARPAVAAEIARLDDV